MSYPVGVTIVTDGLARKAQRSSTARHLNSPRTASFRAQPERSCSVRRIETALNYLWIVAMREPTPDKSIIETEYP